MTNRRIVVTDDNQVIKVVIYHDALGIAAEISPQRALDLALILLDAARRRLAHNLRGGPDLDINTDPNNDPTGLKLSD